MKTAMKLCDLYVTFIYLIAILIVAALRYWWVLALALVSIGVIEEIWGTVLFWSVIFIAGWLIGGKGK